MRIIVVILMFILLFVTQTYSQVVPHISPESRRDKTGPVNITPQDISKMKEEIKTIPTDASNFGKRIEFTLMWIGELVNAGYGKEVERIVPVGTLHRIREEKAYKELDRILSEMDKLAAGSAGLRNQDKFNNDFKLENISLPAGDRKLLVFYGIHIHGPEDGRPEFASITKEEFDGTSKTIKKIAETLEKHGAKGTFEFLQLYIDAVRNYQGSEDNILFELQRRGHEIGVHAHSHLFDQWKKTRESLLSTGINSVTTIGGRAPGYYQGDPGFRLAGELGYSVVTDNYSPLDRMNVAVGGSKDSRGIPRKSVPMRDCSDWGFGHNNEYDKAGSFIHPWRPDYNNNVCNNNFEGKVLYLDHVSGDWLVEGSGEGGGRLQGGMKRKKESLSSSQFTRLKEMFSAALERVSANQLTTWGFVSHEVEYQVSSSAPHSGKEPVDINAINALDDFLGYIDRYKDKLEWVTAKEIFARYIEWERNIKR